MTVVAITGASGGIGEATARHLASLGMKVVLGGRNRRALAAITASIGEAASFAVMDVRDRSGSQALVDEALRAFGRLDVFVANAGAMPIGAMEALALDDWEEMVDVNIKGVMWGIASALPHFVGQGSGHFIATASTAARKIVPGMAIYAGTKAAVAAICDGLRQEAAGKFRVTTLFPGFTATGFADQIKDEAMRERVSAGADIAMPPETVAKAIAYAIEQPEGVNIGEIVVRPAMQP